MSAKIRRSWLLVPMSKADRLTQARQAHADVVVLDLVEFVTEEDKPAARERVRPAINALQGCGAEVFAQVDAELLYADAYACVWPGLTGVIISRLESPGQVAEADTLLSQLEDARGILPGTLEIVAALETAKGNHAAYDISRASQRVSGLTLGRADLIMDLRPEPSGEIHAMLYLMQRLITMAHATGVMPIGAWWRAPDRGLLATPDNTYQAAQRGRAIGWRIMLVLLKAWQPSGRTTMSKASASSTAAQLPRRSICSLWRTHVWRATRRRSKPCPIRLWRFPKTRTSGGLYGNPSRTPLWPHHACRHQTLRR